MPGRLPHKGGLPWGEVSKVGSMKMVTVRSKVTDEIGFWKGSEDSFTLLENGIGFFVFFFFLLFRKSKVGGDLDWLFWVVYSGGNYSTALPF